MPPLFFRKIGNEPNPIHDLLCEYIGFEGFQNLPLNFGPLQLTISAARPRQYNLLPCRVDIGKNKKFPQRIDYETQISFIMPFILNRKRYKIVRYIINVQPTFADKFTQREWKSWIFICSLLSNTSTGNNSTHRINRSIGGDTQFAT